MKFVKVTLVIFVLSVITACTTRIVINMYPPTSSVVDLPICYLESCDQISNEECAVRAYDSFASTDSTSWNTIESKPLSVLVAGSRMFYVQVTPLTALDSLATEWAALACTPKSSPTVQPARHLVCTSDMKDWVMAANSENGSILQLASNSSYQSSCLRISD